MKVFDRVTIIGRFVDNDKVPGILVEDLGDFVVVDTIIGGTWKVHKKHVELSPPPKGILYIKSEVSKETIQKLKEDWYKCIKTS